MCGTQVAQRRLRIPVLLPAWAQAVADEFESAGRREEPGMTNTLAALVDRHRMPVLHGLRVCCTGLSQGALVTDIVIHFTVSYLTI